MLPNDISSIVKFKESMVLNPFSKIIAMMLFTVLLGCEQTTQQPNDSAEIKVETNTINLSV